MAEDDEAGERPEPAQALVQADDTDRAVASALAELTRLAEQQRRLVNQFRV
ncbi:hypothetical protein PAERUG_E6_London_17_VIM_2_12_12_03520 [Pseudomonas aeruginosa]|nr:hypothetical protein [Pseudomonas aeruginosa]CRQ10095.1 hypothetical protein PAERUG_E6_London_17_VIM_2_12_12_03520 [Pseudomonas aeruginosa]